jgi:hypothetical protein
MIFETCCELFCSERMVIAHKLAWPTASNNETGETQQYLTCLY